MQLSVADPMFATELRQRAAQCGLVGAVELELLVKFSRVLGLEIVVSGFRSVSAVLAGLKSGDACFFAGEIAVTQRRTAAIAGGTRPGGLLGLRAAGPRSGRHGGGRRGS